MLRMAPDGHANQVATGSEPRRDWSLIVALRKHGLSGHIVVVVPETAGNRAQRNGEGGVIAPLQSQAGAVNFRYGTGKIIGGKLNGFADSAFWLHA